MLNFLKSILFADPKDKDKANYQFIAERYIQFGKQYYEVFKEEFVEFLKTEEGQSQLLEHELTMKEAFEQMFPLDNKPDAHIGSSQ